MKCILADISRLDLSMVRVCDQLGMNHRRTSKQSVTKAEYEQMDNMDDFGFT